MQHPAAVLRKLSSLCFVSTLVAQVGSTPANELVVAPNQSFAPVPGAFVSRTQRGSLDHHGNVAWVGFLNAGQGGVTSNDDQVVCISRNAQDVTLVAREGAPEPTGQPGETLNFLGSDVVISPTGRQVAWVGTNSGPNGLRDSLYISSAQGTTAVLRVGDPVPPPAVGTFQGLGSSDLSGTAFSASGRLQIFGLTSIAGSSPAIFAGLPGQLETVLYAGQTVGSLPSSPRLFHFDAANMISPDGAFPFSGRLEIGSGSPATTFDDDTVVGYVQPGQPPVVLAREGDPAPGMGGLVYSFFLVRNDQGGQNGEFTYQAYLIDPAVGVSTHWALYRASTQGGTPQVVVQSGMVLGDGSVVSVLGQRVSVGPQGKVAAWCFRNGPNLTIDNDEALLTGQPGAMSMLFREGDPLPTMPGATFGGAFGGSGNSFDRYDNMVFRCQAVTPSGTTWLTLAHHPDRGFQNLFVQGQVIPTSMGFATLVADDGWMMRPTGGGGTSMHSTYGDVARLWAMTVTTAAGSSGNSTGIVRTHLGALTPSTASIPATGGFQMLPVAAGAARADHIYLMVGSLTGTEPGFQFGGVDIPLVNDFWTGISQQSANSSVYLNSLGLLDGNGRNNIAFVLPWNTPYLQGALFHHAVLVFDPSNANLTWVSEPVSVRIY